AELKGAMFPVGRDRVQPACRRIPRPFPTTRPRVSHRLPTAAVLVWGTAAVDSPWKTLPAKPGAEPLAPAASAPVLLLPTPLQRRRVFHASSTAPVPNKPEARWAKGGKRNSAFEWGDVPFLVALGPGRHLGTGPASWMNLQTQFDVSVVETTKGDAIDWDLAGAIPA
ncbi:MAG: hypothetical protein OXH68_00030, partial [Gammaproteobacteria bacterium]|nr:hypothetical protein [Gammaproteobacteria bacterium]